MGLRNFGGHRLPQAWQSCACIGTGAIQATSRRNAAPAAASNTVIGPIGLAFASVLAPDCRWVAGSILLLANGSFTLFAIMPVNRRLMAMQEPEAGAESRAMLVRWGKLHDIRSALGFATTLLFAWALAGAG
jgi:hypothetical protein